jgi:putative FmdB family regulatory protein
MPTYDYVCEHCGFRFEHFQSISSPLLDRCPQCGGQPRRLIGTGAGFLSKSNGRSLGRQRLSRCGHEAPCCGRSEPCDNPGCAH